MRVAANLSFLFKDIPFLERFQAAASCGFRGVECGPELYSHPLELLIATKRETKLEVALINTSKGLASLPGKEEDFKSDLKVAIEYALALECPRIHAKAGVLPSGFTALELKQATDTFVNNMRYAANECSKHNIKVMIEYISVVPNFFLSSYKHALELLKEINCDAVRLQYDFHHAQRTDGNLCQFLKDNIKLIDHIQVSQVPNRHEPDLDGEINFPYVFRFLQELGYNGWLGCEYNPKGDVKDGLQWAVNYMV